MAQKVQVASVWIGLQACVLSLPRCANLGAYRAVRILFFTLQELFGPKDMKSLEVWRV